METAKNTLEHLIGIIPSQYNTVIDNENNSIEIRIDDFFLSIDCDMITNIEIFDTIITIECKMGDYYYNKIILWRQIRHILINLYKNK